MAWVQCAHGMLSGLAGKVAVVTGGAGGLGAAAALRLSREGCRVVVVDIDGDGARKVAAALPGRASRSRRTSRRKKTLSATWTKPRTRSGRSICIT